MEQQIRALLAEHGRLGIDVSTLGKTTDLYRTGLTSHAAVNVMLALEDEFDIEFPERMLTKQTFQSIESIQQALEELLASSTA